MNAARDQNSPLSCYHCGLPVAKGADYPVSIQGVEQPMCCPGCQAVAMAIVSGGLESFYQYRAAASGEKALQRPEQAALHDWKIYDLADVQAEFVTEYGEGYKQANLLLEGITCAACSWLIENHLKNNPAVKIVNLNISSHRCTLVWSPQQMPLSELLQSLEQIGYKPRPATDDQQQQLIAKENRMALFRLGVAGFGMMQAMMVAVGIYTGATGAWLDFLRWLSMLAATPVVFFSAAPFFKGAWASVRSRQLTMDVPVALAIGLAYLASAWATLSGTGEVYFESVSMFAFFLLLGRHIERRARQRNRLAFANLAQLMPLTACCVRAEEGREELHNIPLSALLPGDLVVVKDGHTFPCDGIVESGESDVVEALITGESIPVRKKAGDRVIAGSLNSHSALRIRATATGSATRLSGIERLAIQAADEKPKQVLMADKIARFFIARLLVICGGVFLFWYFKDSSRALWITLSVLVVTCPCALSLAMPAALSAATANLRQRGFLVARGNTIEMLAQVTRVIFDKTGTLTEGKFDLVEVQLHSKKNREQVLSIAAALEADSSHPLALAFAPWRTAESATEVQQTTAAGVQGRIEGEVYRLGTLEFASEIIADPGNITFPDSEKLWLLLANREGILAWFAFADAIRPSAGKAVADLQAMGIAVELLSGDQSGNVESTARQLAIAEYTAGAKPDDKLARLSFAQLAGDKVLMVGDGINDVPVLAGADISVAMASASDLAQTRADSLLLNNQLTLLSEAIVIARRTRVIIRQNLLFSLGYNLLALPLAATGHVAPWAAAIGMTASSLMVVLNALRLNR